MSMDVGVQEGISNLSRADREAGRKDDLAPLCILVVDDDPSLRGLIVASLEKHGMRALSASGRREMIRHLLTSEPSLVVLDLQLGRENGLDVLREIRSRSDVPVII